MYTNHCPIQCINYKPLSLLSSYPVGWKGVDVEAATSSSHCSGPEAQPCTLYAVPPLYEVLPSQAMSPLPHPKPIQWLKPDSGYPDLINFSLNYLTHTYIPHFKLSMYSSVEFMYFSFVPSTNKYELTEIMAMFNTLSVCPTLQDM